MTPKVLNFITGNANKLREVQSILSATPIELRSQNVDVPELQGTIEEISRAKCSAAAEIVRTLEFAILRYIKHWRVDLKDNIVGFS